MKILFLDMDGVLNSEQSFHLNHEARTAEREARGGDSIEFAKQFSWPMGHIYPPLVERLNQILDQVDCKIVLSSSWRILCTPQELAGWLTQKGFRHADRFIDKTDNEPEDARGGQIQRWLNAHPDVKQYVILDDDSEDIVGDMTTKKHPNNFVKTDFMWGLQDAQVQKAIEILSR